MQVTNEEERREGWRMRVIEEEREGWRMGVIVGEREE